MEEPPNVGQKPPEFTDQPASQPAEPPVSVGEVVRKLGPAGPLALASVALPPLSGFALIYFMKGVSDWLRGHQELGVGVYALGFAVLSGLALLPTYAQAALGGFAFGLPLGLPAAMAGFAGGAVIGYVIAWRASGDRVEKLIREHPRWQAVRDALVADHTRNSFWKTTGMVALLRMPPNSPFALTNLVMASVKVPWASFVLGTVVGMLPRTAAAVWIGATLGLDARGEFSTPLWLKISGVILAVVVLAVVMDMADRAIQRATKPGFKPEWTKTLMSKLPGLAVVGAVVIALMVLADRRAAAKDTNPTPNGGAPAAPAGTTGAKPG